VSTPHPLLLGHRGSPRTARENTIPAFENAMLVGLDGVELDVQSTLDGVLVVHHDFHLPDGRLIAALPSRDVLGATLPDNGSVPTLDAVLGWAHDRNAYLNVEIKSNGWNTDGREVSVVRALQRFGLLNRVIISSFNPVSIARVRFADSRLETALLWDDDLQPEWLLARGQLAPVLGVKAVHPRHTLITPEFVERAHARGWRVNTWTVNDPDRAKALLDMGVDGLISDAPTVLLTAAGRLNAPEVIAPSLPEVP
jgi:glycerophosphoryl diester phosphodiesterase